MSVRKATAPFRTEGGGTLAGVINLADSSQAGPWTTGATLIDNITDQGSGSYQSVTLYGFSVQAELVAVSAAIAGYVPYYGKLGKIYAGLVIPPANTTLNKSTPVAPWTNPMLPLPTDTTLFTELWDPAADPMPTIYPASGVAPGIEGPLPINCQLQLPVPVDMSQYADPPNIGQIGLWLTPSLIAPYNLSPAPVQLEVWNATYAVYYEDKGSGFAP